jgi:4a-hydroxytetrahydrobiopterin dehydratase
MAETVLSATEIDERLKAHPGWELAEGALHRELTFADFTEAFAFMIRVAEAAERLDHHPDWSNSWNKVVIDIASHAAGGITDACFALATEVDSAAGS